MDDPYRFIVWGGLGLSAVTMGLGIYTYVWPKKKPPTWVILFLLSALPLISIFRTGTYQSGDLTHQAYFTAEFHESLKEGVWLPRWAGNLNFGFGNPMFLFTYPLPYFLGAGFHGLGFSFINSIKAVLVLTYLMSGFGAYVWGKKHFSDTGAAILTLMYVYAPYHLIDMHFRVAMGEMTALAVIPWVLLGLYKWMKQPNMANLVVSSLLIALLVLSHQAVTLISLPFLIVYTWLESKQKRILSWIYPFLIGTLLSAFYWWPVVHEMRFTHEPIYSQAVEFQPLLWSVISPWKMGFLWQGHVAETANVIGLVPAAAVILSAILLIKGKIRIQRKLLKVCLIFFVFGFFLMQRVSWPMWQIIPLIKNLQFAFRWNAILILLTAIMGAISWDNIKKFQTEKFLIVVVSLIIVPTILNWGSRKMLPPMTDQQIYLGLPGNALFNPYGPATPKWTDPKDPWQKGFPVSLIEVISGRAEAVQQERTSTGHKYQIWVDTESLMKENTYYFPGWKVRVDGQEVELAQKTFETGIIHFALAPGKHLVEVAFENTPDRTWSTIASQGTAIVLLLAMVWEMVKLRNKMASSSNG